ncbi:trypsin-like serine peptidase [Kribbella swartbergensis]
MKVESLAEQLYFTTVHLQAIKSNGDGWTGTGFLYSVDTTRGSAHFLVTNKHVLAGANELVIQMMRRDADGGPLLGTPSRMRITNFNASIWVGHPNDLVDVAVMPFYSILDEMIKLDETPFFRAVGADIVYGVAIEPELDAVEQVTFIGYPNGIYDRVNLLPIARRGTTATPIEVDYQGAPAFLIDASVFGGSSGSPVFIANWGMYTDRKGASVIGSRAIFLGVLAAVHTRRVDGKVEVVDTALIASFNEPIDLGIVYKARCVDECVQILLDAAGLKRRVGDESIVEVSEPTDADKAIADAADESGEESPDGSS